VNVLAGLPAGSRTMNPAAAVVVAMTIAERKSQATGHAPAATPTFSPPRFVLKDSWHISWYNLPFLCVCFWWFP
jgi:hypothetical protein